MDEKKHPNDVIDEAVQATASSVSEVGAVCTGWVLVTQWSKVDGGQAFGVQASDNMATWTRRGLLAEALNDVEQQ